MQIHPFALGALGLGLDHPVSHDVNVQRLTEPLLSLTMAAVIAGDLACYTAFGTQLWVPRIQLAAAVGFGRKLYEPTDPCFVLPEAVLRVPYLPDPITADAPLYQQEFLMTAQRMADYLTALRDAMPPRPFDLHVHRAAHNTAPRQLIEGHAITACPSDHGWWVCAAEMRPFLPAGESFDDPTSAWYVDPHDWADHDEVERLSAEHRTHWPEIYGTVVADTSG